MLQENDRKIFTQSINNLNKFEEFYRNDGDGFNKRIDDLSAEYDLWMEDFMTKIDICIDQNNKEIHLEKFVSKNVTNRNNKRNKFDDFEKIIYEEVNVERGVKRRKNNSLDSDDNFSSTKRAKMNFGKVTETKIENKENQIEIHEENYIVQEQNIFINSNNATNSNLNVILSSNSNKYNITKKYRNEVDEEYVIEEMPSKEEENLKHSLSQKLSSGSQMKIDMPYSDIKKNSISVKSDDYVEDLNNFSKDVYSMIKENGLVEKIKNLEINNVFTDDFIEENENLSFIQKSIKNKIENNVQLNDSQIQKEQKTNSFQNIIEKVSNSGMNSVTSKALTVHNINNNFLEDKINFSQIPSNNIQINTEPNHLTHNKEIINSNTNKIITKSNIHKDKELCMKILYNEDMSSSNLEDSPIVEKWNPTNLPVINKIVITNDIMQTPISTKESKKNIFRMSHNNIFDDHKLVEDQKNKIMAGKIFQTQEKANQNNNNLIQHGLFTFNKQPQNNYDQNQIEENVIPSGYIITDNSGSSDEQDSDFIYEKKKTIPDWANDNEYLKQTVLEQRKINHREIFGVCKIDNLDLNIIFTNGKYNDVRGDSADWKLDESVISSNNTIKKDFFDSNEKPDEAKRNIDFNFD